MGVSENQKRDKDFEKVINFDNLCILNKSNTYFNPFTGSYSAIGLSIRDPQVIWTMGGKSIMISVAVIIFL